jgi:hypothetical protein
MADLADAGQVGSTLSWIGTGLSFIGYWIGIILWHLASTIGYILYLLSQPLVFILQPVGYLSHYLLAFLLLPFRAIAKFEVGRHQTKGAGICVDICSDSLHLSRNCSHRRTYWRSHCSDNLWMAFCAARTGCQADKKAAQTADSEAVPGGKAEAET